MDLDMHLNRIAKHYGDYIDRTIVNDICQIKKRRKSLLKSTKHNLKMSERINLINDEFQKQYYDDHGSEMKSLRGKKTGKNKLDEIFTSEFEKSNHIISNPHSRRLSKQSFTDKVMPFSSTPKSHNDALLTNTQTEMFKY